MRLIFPLVIVSLLAVGCNRTAENVDNTAVVRVGNQVLTRTEIADNVPDGMTKEDSILASEHYIQLWVKDQLLYAIASRNIEDKEKIDQLVENYRKSLMVYQYQEQLINEKLSKEISEGDQKQFYEANADKFQLDRPLIKGMFLKIPVDAPQISKVQGWYKSGSASAIENIEKYSIQNAVVYEYFFDRWVDFSELTDNLPVKYENPETVVKNNKFIELQDSTYCYFLNIREYLLPGDQAPFEYSQPTIKEMLVNQRKMDFLKKLEDDLYQKALDKGQIKFFTE